MKLRSHSNLKQKPEKPEPKIEKPEQKILELTQKYEIAEQKRTAIDEEIKVLQEELKPYQKKVDELNQKIYKLKNEKRTILYCTAQHNRCKHHTDGELLDEYRGDCIYECRVCKIRWSTESSF